MKRPACYVARLLPLLWLGPGCGDSDEDRPPPAPVTAGEAPAAESCTTLRTEPVTLDGTVLQLDGVPAECAGPGMDCPLEDHDEWRASAGCEPGQVLFAQCDGQNLWRLSCQGGGAGGAAGAGGAPASAGQAGST